MRIMGMTEQTASELKGIQRAIFDPGQLDKKPTPEKISEFLNQPMTNGNNYDRHVVLTKDGYYSFLDNIKNSYEEFGFIVFVNINNSTISFNKNEIIRFHSNHSSR